MSTPHFHAVVWIDHREARVFHFNAADSDRMVLHPDKPTRHIHHRALRNGHDATDPAYLHAVAEALADAGAILITGPGSAKTELVRHIQQHDPAIARAIVGVEPADHPSDGQILAHARTYFEAADRMTPQR